MASQDKPAFVGLDEKINLATHDVHKSMNLLILSLLPLGLKDHRLYREGMLSFFFLYRTFEYLWTSLMDGPKSTQDSRTRGMLKKLWSPTIARTNHIKKDLDFYHSSPLPYWILATTEQRVACLLHIQLAVTEKPHVLIAYGHIMYMALFAGGKHLKHQIRQADDFFPMKEGRSLEEAKDMGTNLFTFNVEKGKEDLLKQEFKKNFFEIQKELTEKEMDDIVEESIEIFLMILRLIRELEEICATLPLPPVPPPTTTMSFFSKLTIIGIGIGLVLAFFFVDTILENLVRKA